MLEKLHAAELEKERTMMMMIMMKMDVACVISQGQTFLISHRDGTVHLRLFRLYFGSWRQGLPRSSVLSARWQEQHSVAVLQGLSELFQDLH